MEQILLYYGFNYKGSTSMLVSPTLGQSRKVFKDIVNLLSKSKGLMTKKNETLLEIKLVNGSEILFRSAEQGDALRGLTVSGVLCVDEAAYIVDSIFEGTLLPTTNVHRAPVVLTSTPRFKEGFFYRYYEMGMQGTPGYFSYSFNDYDTSELLSPERLEQYRKVLPANQFKTEYLGQFLDSDSIIFGDFKFCVRPVPGTIRKVVAAGIDWSTGQGDDFTVINLIDDTGQQVFMKRFNDLNTTQTVAEIVGVIKTYNPACIYSEDNSIGHIYNDLLEKEKIQINRFDTTNKSKNNLVGQLQVAFEQRLLYILPIDIQTRELSSYQCEYNPKTGTVTYNAPTGLHDDCVVSLMLAWKAYQERNVKGVYTMGFVSRHKP